VEKFIIIKNGHKKCQSKTCCFYKRVCSELDGYKKCKVKKFGCKAKTKCQKIKIIKYKWINKRKCAKKKIIFVNNQVLNHKEKDVVHGK